MAQKMAAEKSTQKCCQCKYVCIYSSNECQMENSCCVEATYKTMYTILPYLNEDSYISTAHFSLNECFLGFETFIMESFRSQYNVDVLDDQTKC